ncbi:hypothetical protein CAPTEDRAFT_221503 [Capitella teleta]|uniref:Beta-lactamase-related domain-containing protein n=1 Tax=Capitella teleta TaxID=283909 RepID=R7TMD0_CAPTE|nr:hypothetical protein CAPTEDRAFT_221503 [Capitella teleta]|eukprot:ELT92716.1 hypothetical protein CAPTEDRAFT_221503 [Capitella teleta]
MNFLAGICAALTISPFLSFLSIYLSLGLAALAAGVLLLLKRRRTRRWIYHMDGEVEAGFEEVYKVFKQSILSKDEGGAAFSVYFEGRKVVDVWGGYADFGAHRLRQRDSTNMYYSATKGISAIVMAVLVDRGYLDYDAPVSKYWKEFAANGKENITVKCILSHRAGLIAIRKKHKLAYIRDEPEKLSSLLANEVPFWEPDTAQGYHMLTFALYADQLCRRVDPRGRSLGDFFKEEIAIPYNIDFSIGESPSEHHRACRETRASFNWGHFFTVLIPTGFYFLLGFLYSMYLVGTMYLLLFIGNPSDWKPRRLNDPKYRELQCGSSHGFGTARGVAKLMGILANGGEYLGQCLLSAKAIDYLNTTLSSEFDRVVLRHITYGPGTTLMTPASKHGGEEHSVFGHWGAGGQMAFSDPAMKLGWAYGTNYCNLLHGFIIDHRYAALEKAMYECVFAQNKRR